MPNSLTPLLRPLGALVLCGAIGLLASGCGTENVDKARGRALFIQKCGQCHKLAQAATTGVQGPNLDAAFSEARANGEDQDTIAGVVKAQIDFPRPSTTDPAVSMPKELVTGEDADDVASYVGSVAGIPGIAPPKVPGGPGAQVFANNGCGGCRTPAAADPAPRSSQTTAAAAATPSPRRTRAAPRALTSTRCCLGRAPLRSASRS